MYYEVLGLEQGATQEEIKKAYFSLVRQHSPEKDPEKFREIREAYEHLKHAEEEQGPVFAPPKDPWAKRFLAQIQSYQKEGDDKLFRDACEEAFRAFPNEIQFLYLLAYAQRRAGNTGKAVKSGEALVKKEPDNKWFWRELAISYQERGFTRKAYGAFDKAYELGCRDCDFVMEFSLSCNDYEQFDRGIEVLSELIGSKKRWQKEDIPQMIEAFLGLISMHLQDGRDPTGPLKNLKDSLLQYSIYLEQHLDTLLQIMVVCMLHPASQENQSVVQEILDIIKAACHTKEEREQVETISRMGQIERIYEDDRLSDILKSGIEIYFMMDDMESEIRTYSILDFKLCVIEERQEILPQLDIIEAEYPEYFEKIRDFAAQLREKRNLEYLKSSLLKQYSHMVEYIGDGQYFEKYPKEKARCMGTVVYQNEDDMPYVRSGKKIGRNDPCPCGSGKKYKHCCMRK